MTIRDSRVWTMLRLRLRSLLRRHRVEQDLDDELRDHVESEIAERVARGARPDEARTSVLRSLGTIETVKEYVRDTRRVGVIEDALRDLQYAFRVLRRSPAFASLAVLSLALGIGANAAIFQLLDAVRLRHLPVERPSELAIVQIRDRGWPPGSYNSRYPDLTYAQWDAFRRTQQPFSAVLAWSTARFDLASSGESRFAEDGLFVSGDFFDLLGVRPALGRLIGGSDDAPGCGAPGVVLSHAFWQREFGGQPDVAGKTITIRNQALPIVGVTPRGFFGVEVGRSFDLALPLCAIARLYDDERLIERDEWWLGVAGRLRPGVSLTAAASALETMSPPLFAATLPPDYSPEDSKRYAAFRLTAVDGASGFSTLREQYAVPLWILFAIAGLVLLMACVNLANLLLARMAAREREIAVRLTIGASRGRVVRQLLVESLLLAAFGAIAAVALAPVLGGLIVQLMGTGVDPIFLSLAVNWRLIGLAAAIALTTCLLFGLAPAWRASRIAAGEAMKSSARTMTAGRGHTSLRRAFLVLQVTLSLTLVSAGLLFGRSLVNLLTVDAGFRQDHVLEADVDLALLDAPGRDRAAVRHDLLARLRGVAGAEAVATASQVPMVGNSYNTVFVDNQAGGFDKHLARFNRISDDYFRTLGTTMISGRDFDARDTPGAPATVIVNQAFVTKAFRGASPLGTTVRLEGDRGQPGEAVTIVGVVQNTKIGDLREDFWPIVYKAQSQSAQTGTFHQFLIRTRVAPALVQPVVSQALVAFDRRLVFHYHDFQEQIRDTLRLDRVMATLCGFFALLGAVLASIGVYGVTAYSVAQRTPEIGVRLALGAAPLGIVRLILRESALVLAVGIAAGTGLTMVSAHAAESLLYGLAPRDPATLGLSAALLAAVAMLASFVPALRASRVDPTRALRGD